MFLLLLLVSLPVFSQVDLSVIQELDEELPNFTEYKQSDEEIDFKRQGRRFRPPQRKITLEEIKQSGTSLGAINEGALLRKLDSNKDFEVTELIYVKYFNLQDEHGFKYLLNEDGEVNFRVPSRYVAPIKEELALYEPPLIYTPAPDNIVRAEYDKKLSIPPEFSFYTGFVQGDFMKDLFNDGKARSGVSNQYGIHFFTQWKLPVKAGLVLHYERATYKLSNGSQINYSSPSFGPQFKTREFEIADHPIRFQTQFRVSPFARASAESSAGEIFYKFNSADLLFSVERPIKNRLGEFVAGLFIQTQWLNIKDQSRAVSVKASNQTNKTFGLSFSQVFE